MVSGWDGVKDVAARMASCVVLSGSTHASLIDPC